MVPDAELESKQAQEEEQRMAGIKESMTTKQLEDIIETTRLLREAQEKVLQLSMNLSEQLKICNSWQVKIYCQSAIAFYNDS